jgi:hypothetical protein
LASLKTDFPWEIVTATIPWNPSRNAGWLLDAETLGEFRYEDSTKHGSRRSK